ncbi:MAG: dTDP-4-dehydrorhamnose reductase [Maritimibacter sp.]
MKLLTFGKSGQLARAMQRHMNDPKQARFLSRSEADFSDPADCAKHVLETDAEAIVIAAAWTAVDKAETEEAAATCVNATTPGAIAAACAARGLPLVYVSTDYVFSGQGDRAFAPDDPSAPINAYGRSKWAGEQAIRASGVRHVILRTSWVVSADGANFVKTMLRLGATRDQLSVVSDQIGAPTPAKDLALAVRIAAQALVDGAPGGTYHFAGVPDVSWAEFAKEIFAQAGINCAVDPISTRAYPTPAARPKNSRLDCTSFTREFSLPRPDWRLALAHILSDIGDPS